MLTLYRFLFSGGHAITFPTRPQHALTWAARFAKWSGRELLAISEVRVLSNQLELV